ncbi:MAG: adenylate/guanylate cyclase domain-containing protein, partial [Micropepsaceae bacterium]
MTTAAHALSSYVSRLLLARLASDKPFYGPEATRRPAAVLLSDIEGSTALVESFTRSGRSGLEEITWALNGYFSDLVDLVYAHGGDVLYIAGDAFLCYWPCEEEEDLPDAILRAAQAGLAIQTALHGRMAGKEKAFSTRIGIGSGEIAEAFLGGAGGRWQLVATGSALQDVIKAEKHASGGEVVVSPAAWKAIAGRCEGQPQSDAFVKLESIRHPPARALLPFPPQLKDTNVLRPFVPEAVLDRLLVPQAEWLAERRNVTVLLADLPTSAVDTPDDLQRTHQCIRAFQEIVIRFEGTIKVVVDDKGILLLAVFGLPPFAHETDAERAIQAGFALKAALAGLGVTCGIGIATGHGFCGAFGNDVRRDYMLRGDAINLAARLMKATHSEILCDQATTRAVRDRVAFEPLAPLTLKGKSEPVPVFRPIAGAVRKLADGQMVGRAAERALLTHEVEALRNGGAGRAIVVEGDAGLGKSRLMADVSATAQAVGLRVLTAFADPIEQSTSYAAWHSVFAEIFGIQSGEAVPREKIAVFMATMPAFERLAPLLDGVLRLNLTDNELTAEMSGDARAASTIRLLVAVLQKVAETGPTLLVVEDAHWLDASSWALLIETVKTVHPLLIVVATRPADEWSAPKYAELLKAVGDGKLTLSALSAEETTELVRARLQVEAVPESLARFVRD